MKCDHNNYFQKQWLEHQNGYFSINLFEICYLVSIFVNSFDIDNSFFIIQRQAIDGSLKGFINKEGFSIYKAIDSTKAFYKIGDAKKAIVKDFLSFKENYIKKII